MGSFSRFIIMGMVIVSIGSMFIGYSAFGLEAGQTLTVQQQVHEPFELRLVITANNWFNNSIGFEPAFFVVQGNMLESSANITLPAGGPVLVTIINYDRGAAATPLQFANVVGTLNDTEFIVNESNVNSTSLVTNSMSVRGGLVTSSVPDSYISHTFTVQENGVTVINIPIEPSSIETATFTLSAGTYSWRCNAACGSGPEGWGGAMLTPGWMMGHLSVE